MVPTACDPRTCGCLDCKATLHPHLAKRTRVDDARHVSVTAPRDRHLMGHCRVTIDGQNVTALAFELVTGGAGWVAMYTLAPAVDAPGGAKHPCPHCRTAACARVVRGEVRLEEFARGLA